MTNEAIGRLREMATDGRFLQPVIVEDLRELLAERDELAAKVERLTKSLRNVLDGLGALSNPTELSGWAITDEEIAEIFSCLESTPAQNLAKVRAEALRDFAKRLSGGGSSHEFDIACELRAEADRIEAEAAR